MQRERGHQVGAGVEPFAPGLDESKQPKNRDQTEPEPDERDLETLARGQPVEGIDLQQPAAEGGARVARAGGEQLPLFTAAQRFCGGRFVLPDAREDERRQTQRAPAEEVRGGERGIEPVEFPSAQHLVVHAVEGEHAGHAGAEEHQRKRIVSEQVKQRVPVGKLAGHPRDQRRPARREQRDERHRQPDGFALVLAERRAEQAEGEREKQVVQTHQHHAPKFCPGHATEQQRNRQHGKNRQQSIHGGDGGRGEFAEHDVVAPQVGEKEQPERALAFLLAHGIGGPDGAGEQRVKVSHHRDGNEEREAGLARGFAHENGPRERADDDREQCEGEARPVGGHAARGHAQFPGDDGEQRHGEKLQIPNSKFQTNIKRQTPIGVGKERR